MALFKIKCQKLEFPGVYACVYLCLSSLSLILIIFVSGTLSVSALSLFITLSLHLICLNSVSTVSVSLALFLFIRYVSSTWNDATYINPLNSKRWMELTISEKVACKNIGYDQRKWDKLHKGLAKGVWSSVGMVMFIVVAAVVFLGFLKFCDRG